MLTYDEIGNLLTYDENTYTWQNGRELAGINNSKTGNTITYKYNSDGIRTYKNVNGVETYYYLRGDKVIYEKTNDNIIYYMYDDNDELIGLTFNNSTYYYKKNLQGDIIGILDENLNDVVQYSYDSWGKVLNVIDANGNEITDPNHIGNINPYRYKGYRYDNESELYYLQSRYYNPEFGRFINADAVLCVGSVGGENNLYLYCSNNPINNADYSGYFFENILKAINNAINNIVKTIVNNSSYRKTVTSNSSRSNTVLSKNNRKPGKTPPKSWPELPKNLKSKRTKWNSKGYWDGKYGETTWDSRSHGSGIDRGNGQLDGHWDTDRGRFNRDGLELIVGGAVLGATGYVTYRVIRLIPSLTFPPSIVPNLVIP